MNESLMGFGFGARARLPERVCAGNSVEFLSLARSVGGSCSLSTSCARALALAVYISLCVCVSAACNSCVNVNRSTSLLCAVQSSLLQSFICGCRIAKAERYVNVNKIRKTNDKIKQF